MPADYAPQQKRSRETLERLLLATIRVLDEHGLEGALIPRIAAAAGVAPASVYRRFADKDALLRAAFLHVLPQSNESSRQRLRTVLLRKTLSDTAERLMAMLFEQYRSHSGLFRALTRFIDADSNQAFVDEAWSIIGQNVNELVDVFLTHRKRIKHPAPERALQVAILVAVSSIQAIALEPRSLWHVVVPASDDELAHELARGFVSYLRTRS